jgi:hydroxyacylglutathione hydrolase
MKIHCLPAFDDNYLWLFHADNSRLAYAVDPGDARVIETALQEFDLELAGILLTHHHYDHIGGVAELIKNRSIPVYAGDLSAVPQVTELIADTTELRLDDNLSCQIMFVPGHTLDHVVYYFSDKQVLFCGDTLFASGCGRVFEGTKKQMYESLQKLSKLPATTQVYCAHEYTLANLNFSLAVEPSNQDLKERHDKAKSMRQSNIPTVPFSLADELLTNPFIRVNASEVIACAQTRLNKSSLLDSEVFAAIRSWKDDF